MAEGPQLGVRRVERWLHGLHLYGAAGIVAFGWALCQLAGWPSQPWLGLWFCAALLVYNNDRLHADPADAINVPLRQASGRNMRTASLALALGAGAVLLLWPLLGRDWLTLGAVALGVLVCLNYSIPILGFRFKQVPVVKTLFAPSIVMVSLVGLPWLHSEARGVQWEFLLGVIPGWGILLFNMTLCDCRDVRGDARTGILSLPVLLGPSGTRRFLWSLLALIDGLLWLNHGWSSGFRRSVWLILALVSPVYLGALLVAIAQPRSERFYEWWVEGLLFLPAFACLLAGL